MIRYLYSRDGSLFREKRMLRMAPDQQEQIRQLQEQNAALQKKVEELKTTVERLEKSMNSTKKVVNGPNFPVRQNGVVLPRAAQNSPAARDPRMQARMRQMGSSRSLENLVQFIPKNHRYGRDVKRCDPIPQPWTAEERANLCETIHPTMGRIRFENKGGQWVYRGIVMTPDEMRKDQLGIQQKYADQENERREHDRMLQINLNRARAGQPLPKDMVADYNRERDLERMVADPRMPEPYDPNNIYNRPGYTFIPNSIASRDAARGNRPQSVPSVSVGRVYEVDDRSTEEFHADLKKKVEVKMARINSSVESRKYDVPRIPNQTMSVTFPGSLLGYKGNARGEILFKPREGVFADARSEMIAKQIGVTFLTGPDGLQNNMSSVEVFFANEGVYTVQTKKTLYTDAGPVDTIDVKIDRAQMAIEQQKLKEAMARPNPDIWGIIPSGIKDGVGNTFMYRIRNGVLESYTPYHGYTVFNAANGKWYAPGDGVRRQNAEMNVAYAALFPGGQQPVAAKQPQQQSVQQPAPSNQPAQQPVQNQQPEKPKVDPSQAKPAQNDPAQQPAPVQPPVAQAKPVEPVPAQQPPVKPEAKEPVAQAPIQQPAAPKKPDVPVANAPEQPKVVPPVAPEKPKPAGVEKNDAITEATPDLSVLLPERFEGAEPMARKQQISQLNGIKAGKMEFEKTFQENVNTNGLLLTRSEYKDLLDEYAAAAEGSRMKNSLNKTMAFIRQYLTAKVPASKDEQGVPDAPLRLPNEEQVNVIKPTNEQKNQLRDDVIKLGKGIDLDAIVTDENYSVVKNNLQKVEEAFGLVKDIDKDWLKLYKEYADKDIRKGDLGTKLVLGERSGVSTLRIYVDVNAKPDEIARTLNEGIQEMKMCVVVHSEVKKLKDEWGAPVAVDQNMGSIRPYANGDFQKLALKGMNNLKLAYTTLTDPQKKAIEKSGYTILVSTENKEDGADAQSKALYVDCTKESSDIQRVLLDFAKKNIAQA